ncbi:MAG: hypothetical protein JSR65_09760, partial [Proteobacteria bacterium]|nr:hypothetical protein [Pseudomonadota bacterium]
LRQKKRVFRLLAHPRFRAAYDFLLLRAGEGEQTAALGAWWTQAQNQSHDQLAAQLNGLPAPSFDMKDDDDAIPTEAPRKRPRRRRRGTTEADSAVATE